MRNQTRRNLFKPLSIFFAGLCLAALTTTARAATVTLNTDDASGTSSITGSTNWNNNAAPNGSNDYFTSNFTINTPTASATFAGKSLTINAGGQLQGKFSSSQTLTINYLILAGGIVRNVGNDRNFAVGSGSAFVNVSSASSLGAVGGGSGTGQLVINSVITNSGALLIPDTLDAASAGAVRFSSANPYSGTLTVSNNTYASAVSHLLQLNNVDAVSNATVNLTAPIANPLSFGVAGTFNVGLLTGSSAQALTNTSGAAITLSIGGNNGSGVFSGALTDSGAVTKVGSGTLILNGANSYSGNTIVSGGTLVVSSAQSGTGNISVANGATLGVVVSGTSQLSPTNLTLGTSAGVTLIFSNVSNTSVAPISATNVSFAGTLTLNVNGGTFVAGNNYPLITWTGTGPVATNGISLNVTGLPPRSSGSLTIISKTLYLQINSPQPLSWATGSGTWDVNDSSNTIWIDSSGATTYYQEAVSGDQVLFGNTVGLGGIVTLNTNVSPAAVTVSNSTTSYTFSGSGAITGSTGLTKSGAGVLIITTTNTYTGVTAISGGTLQLGDGTANNGVVAGDITNNAALVFANPAAQTFAGAISGSGTLTKSGAGTLTLSGANTYTGNTTVSAGELLLSSAQSGTGNISVADGATLGLVVSGTSQLSPAALTLGTSAGATLEFNGLSSTLTAPINAGSVSFTGSLTVNINSGSFNAGNSYPLVNWTGTGLGSTNGLALNLPFGVQGYLLVSGNTLYLQTTVRAVPTPAGFNYEVYPGSAFYMTQMVDSVSYPYTAQFANGFYFHPTGFSVNSDYTLSTAQKQQICNNFSNQFSIVEGDMGFSNPNPGGPMGTIAGFGMTPILDFVNEATYNNALWRQVIASCGKHGGAASVMTPPHRVYTHHPLGWYDPTYDPLRTNILSVGCSGSGVDAPVYLYVHNGSFYQQVIWQQRDQTVSYGKKFIYILSPNNDVGQVFMTDTLTTVRSLEDNGHEPNTYTPELYGKRPVNLTPETTNFNGVVQANWTITGLAYYLLKHRDGEPGTLDLYAVSNGVSYAKGVISPVLSNAAQILPLNPTRTNTYTLNLTNSSQWLDYAGVLRARACGQLTNWNVTFKIGSTDITSNVLSNDGYLFLGAQRLMPQTNRQVTLTIGPKGAAQPLDLVVEALPHAGVNQALDILAFQYQTNQTPPSMALWNVDRNSLQGVNMEPIWFTVGDAETIASNLTVTVSSSNQQLVPNTNCAVNISGVQRVLTVSPVSTQWGSTVISVAVSDGTFSVTKSFNYFVQRTNILPVLKANNTTNLDLTASWVGNTLPGPYDLAIWTNIITGPSTTTFGNDIVWSGLQVANAGGPVAFYGTNTLILNAGNIDLSASSYDLTFNCPLDLESVGSWNVPSSRTITFNQPVTGGGGFTLSNGKLVFAATNSFVGAVRINNGTVYMPNAGAQSLTTLDNNSVLKIANSGSLGTGGLNFSSSSAQLQLSNNISVLSGKAISLYARLTSIPAVLNVGGTNQFGGTTTYEPGGGNYWFQSDAGQLILSGTITSHASGNRATTLRGAGSGSVTGVIQDGSATMQVYKDGSGTWDLNGDQTYSGVTTINAGTLTVSGSIASTNTLTALPGTIFGGSGTLNCPVVITNATLAPGVAGIGTLTVNNDVTLNDGSQTVMELSKLPTDNDAVVGVGNLTYAGSLIVTNVAGAIVPGDSFQLFGAASYLGGFTNIILPPLGYGLIWSNTLTTDGTISVVLTNGLIWRGTNSVWDVNNTGNLTWLSALDHVTPQSYNENGVGGPVVQFDDTVGSGVTNLTLGVTVKPVSVTVSNATRNYSISGAGKISGTAALTKIGGGTLTLGVTSDYSSGTTLGGGLLRLNGGAGLPANGPLALTGSAALDLGRNTQSIGALTFTQSANATVLITNGSLAIGDVTKIGATSGSAYNVLDMRKAASVVLNQPANNLWVGGTYAASAASSGGEWYLPTNVNFTVNQLLVGRGGAYNGSDTNHGWIHLGQSNVVNADSIYLGVIRSDGTLDFATNFANPSLTLRGVAGGSSRVSWIRVGDNSGGSSQQGYGLLDLSRGTVDALINTLEVGTITGNSAALGKGTVNFSNGTVDASTIVLGRNYTAGGTGGPNGTFNQNSGTVKVQSLVLGENAGQTGTPKVVGNYNLNGGTLRAQSIGLGVGTVSSNAIQNLNWNAGVIKNYDAVTDLSVNGIEVDDSDGNPISIDTVQINLGTSGYQAFDVDAGRTVTVDNNAVISAASPVTFYKTGSGTLLINGTDNNAGSLVVSNGTFGGDGVIAGTVSVRSGATLSPGPGIGTLTVSNLVLAGNAAFEIDLTTLNQSDSVVASGTLTNAGTGTLTVVNTGGIALSDGDSFDLFNKPLANAGALQVSLPPLDPSLYWINNLAVDGTVVVATKPVLNWQTTTTNSIVFSWPTNSGAFHLQTQTNSLAKGLGTNWVNLVGGSNPPVNIRIGATNGSVFFRLTQ